MTEVTEGKEPQNQTAPAAASYDPEQLVPVINTEARIRSMAWTARGEPNIDPVSGLRNHVPRETGMVKFLPGPNFIRWGDLDRVGFAQHLEGLRGALVVQEPAKMPEYEAVALAGNAASGRALRHWLSIETRAPVRTAILERLKHPKFRSSDGQPE